MHEHRASRARVLGASTARPAPSILLNHGFVHLSCDLFRIKLPFSKLFCCVLLVFILEGTGVQCWTKLFFFLSPMHCADCSFIFRGTLLQDVL